MRRACRQIDITRIVGQFGPADQPELSMSATKPATMLAQKPASYG
jgi:hypothetical protein